jgi:hypothetical protein
MRLFHFSDRGDIDRFVPRPVRVPSTRPPGQEWLNGPLVWAIDEWHQPMYLFPRDCPRLLFWPTDRTTAEDRRAWWGERACRMVAHVERSWLDRIESARLFRYLMPNDGFASLGDAGMAVSSREARPLAVEAIDNLPAALAEEDVELRVLDSLAPLRAAVGSSLHVSGIRLRNAASW